jgi:hypothetical protein
MNLEHHTNDAERHAHRLRNGILSAAVLLVLAVSAALALPGLRGAFEPIAGPAPGWLVLAVLLELGSCLCYVAIVRLVLPDGPFRQVRWLAWAEMAFGELLPVGGAGGLAVGAWAMRAWRLSWTRVVNRSAVLFLLPSVVNVVTLALAGIGLTAGLGGPSRLALGLVTAGVALALVLIFLLLPWLASHAAIAGRQGPLGCGLRRTAAWAGDTETILRKPDWRHLGNIGYVVFDIAALWASLRATGITAPVLALVAGYQVGYLANVVPVPAGIGVLDGGLIGALVLYGLPVGQIAGAVVIYHAIALLTPIPGGAVAFARLRHAITVDRQPQALPGAPALILHSSSFDEPVVSARRPAFPLQQTT